MCGIVGVVDFGCMTGVSEELIVRMRDTMIHRGPDDAGIYIAPDRTVGLGHRRLNIVDLSVNGRQPMTNEDGTIWITYNGEVYNHEELRSRLERRGHRYRSRTDTETILHLYEERDTECVNDLVGMFAFAIWDTTKNRLFLARDRLGKKPLYYTCQNGAFIFASEIKAIVAHPSVAKDVNEEALYNYLTFAATPAPSTLFRGISKLPAGYSMTCDLRGNAKQTQYWDAVPSETLLAEFGRDDGNLEREDWCVERVRDLLGQSVSRRMMADVPFGVFLSGGVDSSTNVALMAKMMDRPVDTFSVGFREHNSYNEFQYARAIAEEFKTNHHEIVIDHNDAMEYVPSMVYHQDEPIADWVCVPLYFVSKLARESGTVVVQIGEGSDELFFGYGGYMSYLRAFSRYWKPYLKMPPALRRLFHTVACAVMPTTGKYAIVEDLLRKAAVEEDYFTGGTVVFSETQKRQVVRERVSFGSGQVVRRFLAQLESERPRADLLERMVYVELKNRLPELLLMRLDKIMMSVSVEGRAPFLDQDLVEFVLSIPSSLRIKGDTPKYVLKQAVKGVIPESVITRTKQGFSAPVSQWLRGEFGEYVADRIMNSSVRARDIFDYEHIEEMLKRQKERRGDYAMRIWALFNLSMWHDQWIA